MQIIVYLKFIFNWKSCFLKIFIYFQREREGKEKDGNINVWLILRRP